MFGLPVWCSAFLSSHPFGELFFNRGSRSGPFASKRIGSFSALVCIDVATVPKAALTAAVEASFAATPAVAAASATLPTSTLVLSAALFPAAKTVSRALVMVPLLFISDPPISRSTAARTLY
jgi:hypothetical protein